MKIKSLLSRKPETKKNTTICEYFLDVFPDSPL